jgi:hypothetical protein
MGTVVVTILPSLNKVVDASKAFEDVLLEQVIVVCGHSEEQLSYLSGIITQNQIIKQSVHKKVNVLASKVLATGLDITEVRIGEKLLATGKLFGNVTETFRGLPWQQYLGQEGIEPLIAGRDLYRFGMRSDHRMI